MAKRKPRNPDQKSDPDQVVPAPQLEAWMQMPNGAKAKRCQYWWRSGPKAGRQCPKAAMVVAKTCRTHGGTNASRIGMLNNNWKGGSSAQPRRYASRLGTPELDVYLRALKDPTILSLEDEIALTDVQLQEMVTRANGEHSDPASVLSSWLALKDALRSGDRESIRVAIEEHDRVVTGRADKDRAWSQVNKLMEKRRNLVESERRRLVEQHMFMSREQAHAYGQTIVEIVTRHVQDRQVLLAIMTDFRMVQQASQRPQLAESSVAESSVDGEVLSREEP